MALPLISLRDASVAHRDGLAPAIHQVSVDVHRGDWIAVAGDNGSGKTTLLATLAGVLPLRAGRMERAETLRVALLLQDPDDQLVASSVEHELLLSVPRDVDDATRRARIAAAIERFELDALLRRNPHCLSGGEKQRLALATVWLESPDVLLLDEPLSFLDDEMSARVVAFVRELNANGTAIVWATPGGGDVERAHRVLVLRDGHIVNSGGANRAPNRAPALELEQGSPEIRRATRPSVKERVSFESVTFSYDGRPVIENVNLRISAGESVGITGRNGSGKSTLLLLAGGALAPARGRITRDVSEHGVLYLPQSPERLFFAESVEEEICFGLERRGIGADTARSRADDALTHVGLEPGRFALRSPFELSFGEMRRVAFAIAFALAPELLLLDEPASCLDTGGRVVLDRLVDDAGARGAGVMIASHEPAAVRSAARVVDLRAGARIGAAGAQARRD